ncbi:hypothetical protein ACFL5K_01135 [Gemmatimonadota bacterium]
METFGNIEAILNENVVIISSSVSLAPDDIVSVFYVLKSPKLKEQGFPDPILYPGGELRIVCNYKEDKYLAECFRETKLKKKKIVGPSPLGMGRIIAQLQPETKEITEEIKGKWSSTLKKSQSLNIQIPTEVSIGDLIGRL